MSPAESAVPTLDTRLSDRVAAARPSATGAISELARRLGAEGRSVISLSEGELDFDTPEHVREAAIQGIAEGQTRYTDVGGTPALKAAVAAKFARDNHLTYTPAEIIAATGAKQILFNALLATLNPGDEAIVVAPYWVSYTEMARLAGGTAVVITPDAGNDFKLTPALLEQHLTPNTRWLILNAPCNPSGALYSREEFAALAAVIRKHPRLLVMSDDIYEKLVYEGEFVSFAEAAPDMHARTLTINGVSKSHAMTGWRLGYAGGPAWLIKAMNLLQSQSTSNPSSVSQAAAVAALNGSHAFLDGWRERLRTRRDMALGILHKAAPVLTVRRPPAAFYLFADCRQAIGMRTPKGETIATDADLARYLIEEAGVAVVPGSAFGLAPYLRLTFCIADERLQLACERIVAACAKLTR
ncbi:MULTISPECIES: pyridoxal phosphate-dependent aminotransferase [unclassified Achromobacter]|uniref:pyridoxal phosphate-dependent aminotransferase n=1 Tax=unclassified Achromobacter TaxID=2626865 RepID=UPI000B51A892|nr:MULTISPECIES: pyridoxal phosphate-dependent aminotransferase [unclassified Achromobacter]OWT80176.1 aspartate aminotransferase [Achromobacter sp. HZ34]OWT82059.1 aspartate aminotransferase [Achromobacter sp. HZ28]